MADRPTWHRHAYVSRGGRWIAVAIAGTVRLEGAGATEAEARANLDAVIQRYESELGD